MVLAGSGGVGPRRRRATLGLPASHVASMAIVARSCWGIVICPPVRWRPVSSLNNLRALAAGIGIACGVVENSPAGIDVQADYDAFVARWRQNAAAD